MADVYSNCGCGTKCGDAPDVRVVYGNDLTVEALLSVYDKDSGVYKPLDLSDAADVSLRLVGTFSKVQGKDTAVAGSKVSALFSAGSLGVGVYGVEVTFKDSEGNGRAFERSLIGIVATSGEATTESSAEGDTGEGLNITVDVRTRTVRIGGTGATDYPSLTGKPSINGMVLEGDKTPEELGMYSKEVTDEKFETKSHAAEAERKVLTKKIYLGENIASLVSLGSGWSGNINTGFTHTTGTEPLRLNATESGAAYLITINTSSVAESSYFVSIGDGYLVDAYTGQSQQRIGFISDGGNVKITPDSSYSGTITVKVQKIVPEESATEIVDFDMANVDANNMGDTITSFWNVSIGPDPGTLGKSVNSSRNIGIGVNALRDLTSGTRNIAVGTFAAVRLKNAKGNVAIGADVMFLKEYGNDNIAIGRASMASNAQMVNRNICIGLSSGANLSGDDNVCIGHCAGYRAMSGNTYVGKNAGYNFTGANNIAIGRNAGYVGGTVAGNWNICIGQSSAFENNVSFSTAIGYQACATKSNQLVLGGDNITESLLHGDIVVRGTDSILRKIVFNNDGTIGWTTI